MIWLPLLLFPLLLSKRRDQASTIGKILPRSPIPGMMPAQTPASPDPRRAAAARLANMLFLARPNAEDRDLVYQWQQAEGIKPTGLYGPGTAIALAERYGIVPPQPRYWTKSGTGKVKAAYSLRLRAQGKRDPARAEEWDAAAAVIER